MRNHEKNALLNEIFNLIRSSHVPFSIFHVTLDLYTDVKLKAQNVKRMNREQEPKFTIILIILIFNIQSGTFSFYQ